MDLMSFVAYKHGDTVYCLDCFYMNVPHHSRTAYKGITAMSVHGKCDCSNCSKDISKVWCP